MLHRGDRHAALQVADRGDAVVARLWRQWRGWWQLRAFDAWWRRLDERQKDHMLKLVPAERSRRGYATRQECRRCLAQWMGFLGVLLALLPGCEYEPPPGCRDGYAVTSSCPHSGQYIVHVPGAVYDICRCPGDAGTKAAP